MLRGCPGRPKPTWSTHPTATAPCASGERARTRASEGCRHLLLLARPLAGRLERWPPLRACVQESIAIETADRCWSGSTCASVGSHLGNIHVRAATPGGPRRLLPCALTQRDDARMASAFLYRLLLQFEQETGEWNKAGTGGVVAVRIYTHLFAHTRGFASPNHACTVLC